MAKKEVKDIAHILIDELLKEGFTIQRYNSYSTNSIYLKLDFGVCHSIRISDHIGKKHLSYRYNIGSHIPKCDVVKDEFVQYYYPKEFISALMEQVKKVRNERIKKYGAYGYQKVLKKVEREKTGARGFWEQAYIVSKQKNEERDKIHERYKANGKNNTESRNTSYRNSKFAI